MRYELPPNLSPQEERAVLAGLERYLERKAPSPSPWALAGRARALRLGALESRRHSSRPWPESAARPFRGSAPETRGGRGDSR